MQSEKAIMRHLGMEPRTTAVGAKEQDGDVEASNGALKRRLEQALLVVQTANRRGSSVPSVVSARFDTDDLQDHCERQESAVAVYSEPVQSRSPAAGI